MCASSIAAEQVPGCPVFAQLVKPPAGGKPTLRPKHPCKLLNGAGLDYSLASRALCKVSSPCTNRPVMCPVCLMYGWSYNMEAHVAEGHCIAAKGGEAVASCAPLYHERE